MRDGAMVTVYVPQGVTSPAAHHNAGNVLYLKTDRPANSYFNLIKAASDGESTFALSGDGSLRMYKASDFGCIVVCIARTWHYEQYDMLCHNRFDLLSAGTSRAHFPVVMRLRDCGKLWQEQGSCTGSYFRSVFGMTPI